MDSKLYSHALLKGLQPPPNIPLSEWSDKYRVLARTEGAESGKWKTSRTPYLKEPMDCLSPMSPYQKVVFMKGVQIGGTSVGLNFLAYIIHIDPSSFMFVEPTMDIAKKISKQRINGMINDMPLLQKLIKEDRSRQTSNTLFIKDFDGGILVLSGANSAASLRSMPIRYLVLDEVDAYPADLDGEGSAIELAIKRTETFHNKKILIISTPTIKGESNVEVEYSLSDMREYHVPCPQCGTYQKLEFEALKFDYNKKYDLTSEVYYACVNGCQIKEFHKTNMLANGKWIKQQPDSNIAGFHLSSLYSPVGWKSWESCVTDFLKYRKTGNIHVLKTFVNTVLGESFELPNESLKIDKLVKRRKKLLEKNVIVPDDILLMAAGADVQDDRIEITIFGFGLNERVFVIEHKVIMGIPSELSTWRLVRKVLDKQYRNSHMTLRIQCTLVDSGGHFTDNVYNFCKENTDIRIFAGKGASREGLPIITKPSKNKVGAYLFQIGTDTAKELIFSKLRIDNPTEAGYISFDEKLTDEYFLQLTSEKRTTTYVKGLPKKIWKKTRDRNEGLDCFVYGLSAIHIYCFLLYPEKTVNQVLEYCKKYVDEHTVENKFVEKQKEDNSNKFRVVSKGVKI
jgi:phage terminase large subunit GpA-like protein